MTEYKDLALEELRILLLRHLEGSLSDEEESKVQELLRSSEVAAELEGLRKIENVLKTDKTLFCPDVLEIDEFLATGKDPSGRIASHLEECASCQQEAQALREFKPEAKIPPILWETVTQELDRRGKVQPAPEHESFWSTLPSRLSFLFRKPVLAMGAAAAVVALLVVYFYPHPEIRPTMIALSSVTWEDEYRVPLGLMAPPQRERVAFLIILKDFRTAMPQQRIDSLYGALTPNDEEMERYLVVSPAIIKQLFTGSDSTNLPWQEVVGLVQRDLRVRTAILVTLTPENGQTRISCMPVDALTRKPLEEPLQEVVTAKTLESTMRRLAYGALKRARY
jgi:hypothetical protein